MRLNRLDLNLLVCLDALIAERNVSKAAERVFLGQSAMSSALARLRRHFNDELLVLVGRSMVPTELAQSLEKPVRQFLLQAHAISSIRPQFDPAHSEMKLRLVTSDYVCMVLMTRLLPRAAIVAPNISIEICPFPVHFKEEFDSGSADLLLVPDVFLLDNHPRCELFRDGFSCLVWAENPAVGESLTEKQYLSMGHVAVEWGAERVRAIDEDALRLAGKIRRNELVVPNFNLAGPLLVGTNRVATVQTLLAQQFVQKWPLRMLPCPIATPIVVECLQWHTFRDHDPAIMWFRNLVSDVAAELMPAVEVKRVHSKRVKTVKTQTTRRRVAKTRREPKA
jgi:LysR family transcriptional regulator, nod-box dependent transcriptional activator